MSMVVRNNLSAVNTLNTLNRNHTALAKSLQTVSSGMRINSAKDDTSGYAISERMRVQIRSLNQDNQNTQNGHSMMKVAEGAVQSTVDILKTLKEKVINAANDTNTDSDRAQIQKELNQSIDQINDNANVTYNGKYLVDGSKNSKGEANYTSLTNQSLYSTTSGADALTRLKDRTGRDLNIQSSDTITVSYVRNGATYSGSYTVGGTSLQEIFAFAETLHGGKDFADQLNAGIAKISGISNPQDLIDQATYASAFVPVAEGVKDAAAVLLQEYNGLEQALSGALTTLSAKVSAVVNDSSYSTNFPYTAAHALADYQIWLTSVGMTDQDGTSYPSTSTMASAGGGDLGDVIEHMNNAGKRSSFSVLNDLYIAYNDYNAAYNALSKFQNGTASTTNTSWGTSDLSQANRLSPPTVDLIDAQEYNNYYPFTSTQLSTFAKYAQAAEDLYNRAVAIDNMGGGPVVLSGTKIGISHAGEIVQTANLENAVSVLANNSGVDGQISGFTVSITDKDGNIKKSVNAVLDAWEESIRAENKSDDNAVVIHTGTKANQAIKIGLTDMRARALGLQAEDGTTLNVSTQKNANAAINVLDNALKKALDQQTTIGSIESRLGYTSTNLTTAIENVTASESTIRDADMALAMTEYTKNNILAQSSQAMLAQANQSNNQVLSLLR